MEDETDLRYFDEAFTTVKPVQLTPPSPIVLQDEEDEDEDISSVSVLDEDLIGSYDYDKRFVDFSYCDLPSALGSPARSMSAFLVT